MTGPREIIIDSCTPEELLRLSGEQLAAFVFAGEPLLFRAGTASLLGQFRLHSIRLTIELAQVDGGSEGVLSALWRLAERYARHRSRGNDLSTPRPEYGFTGLQPGDRWCLCSDRWQEALEITLRVGASATVRRENLLRHAVDVAGGPV